MVNDRWFFNWKTKRIFVGNPFSEYYVGVKEWEGEWIEVWFNYLKLGEMNPDVLQMQRNMQLNIAYYVEKELYKRRYISIIEALISYPIFARIYYEIKN